LLRLPQSFNPGEPEKMDLNRECEAMAAGEKSHVAFSLRPLEILCDIAKDVFA
jgi:hypothetical protein